MDRAYFVTNLGNNFPDAYFCHRKNSGKKKTGKKKNETHVVQKT